MTDPITFTSFLQRSGGSSPGDPVTWRIYTSRDDVNERSGYWAMRSDGRVEYVDPIDSVADSLVERENNQRLSFPGSGFIGAVVGGVNDALASGADAVTGGAFNFSGVGDPLDGDVSKAVGMAIIDPQGNLLSNDNFGKWLGAIREHLSTQFGYDAFNISPEILHWANEVTEQMTGSDNVDELMLRTLMSVYGPDAGQTLFAGLFSDPAKAKERGRIAFGITEPVDPSMEADALPDGFNSDFFDVVNRSSGSIFHPETGGGAGGPGADGAGAGGTDPAGTTGPSDGAVNLPDGDFGGVVVTQDLLNEFVDSDWRLGFNAMLNSFRDAGAAAKFMEFLQNQASRYLGEFEGGLAQQALAGQIPTGSFATFLQEKTGAQIAPNQDPNAPNARFAEFSDGVGGQESSGTAAAATTATAPAGSEPVPAGTPAVSPSAGETAGLTPNSLSSGAGSPSADFIAAVTGS
jgi:hypothetical protein